ncbi:MAG: alpha/beta fold hydrolase [Rhodospirillales bacterium]|nr:alpha/beta fold hydrolase [Rhodospirillales bacterium]
MSAIDVSYRIEGDGPALYMVHGIGSRKITWDGIIPALRDHFTCVSYDLRGHGESPIPPVPYTLDQLVEDLEALRAKLGHEKIHVIGHSLGGMIGPAYAHKYPDRILSVGLLSTAAGRTEEDRAKLQGVISAMEEKGSVPVLSTLVARWYTDDFIEARPDLIEARIEQVNTTPDDVFLSVFHIYAKTEMAPWLHEINCPCLVLTGELDGACSPRHNEFMANELPDAELVILDGIKHSILIEGPERVAPPLRDFLLKQDS